MFLTQGLLFLVKAKLNNNVHGMTDSACEHFGNRFIGLKWS
jgi:hypothetical protein